MERLNGTEKPVGISLADAYAAIRVWYRDHVREMPQWSASYAQRSTSLIGELPEAGELAVIEFVAILREVIIGYLEWGFFQSDGRYKMGDYAYEALNTVRRTFQLTPEERLALKTSKLWPFLNPNSWPEKKEKE